ncbi:MAG: arsenate-mycothiol transferase ArsC [Betaproteobacteria bacterium]
MTAAPRHILFLCTDNARDSLVAEAILRSVGGTPFRAHSAGVVAASRPAPGVLEFLESRGIGGAFLHPKGWEAHARSMDFVFAFSAEAAQLLPHFAPQAVTAHWNVDAVEVRDVFWTLMRRIKIFTSLPARPAPRQRMQERLHAIAAWH